MRRNEPLRRSQRLELRHVSTSQSPGSRSRPTPLIMPSDATHACVASLKSVAVENYRVGILTRFWTSVSSTPNTASCRCTDIDSAANKRLAVK